MKKTIRFSVVMLFVGMLPVSCGTHNGSNQDTTVIEESATRFPTITENGVEPFLLGVYAPYIAPQGDWYDNIEVDEKYEVMYGMMCHVAEVSYEDYKRMEEDDEIMGVISHEYKLYLDEGVSMDCDEHKRIKKIAINSSDLKLANGVCVGMSIEEINKRAKTNLKMIGITTTDAHLVLDIQGVPSNIEVNLADKNGILRRYFGCEEGTLNTNNWKELDWGYEIPIEEDKGDTIISIVVQ